MEEIFAYQLISFQLNKCFSQGAYGDIFIYSPSDINSDYYINATFLFYKTNDDFSF